MQICPATLMAVSDPERLLTALRFAARGRRRRPDVAWGLMCAEEVALRLSDQLRAGRWRPSPCRVSIVHTPKPRPIARPTFEDRVVHAAVVALVEPWWRRRARPESMACRPGGGAHRAVLALAEGMKRHAMVVHLDLRAFFPSIGHDRVGALLGASLRDPALAGLIEAIARSGGEVYRSAAVRDALALRPAWPPPGHGLALGSSVSRWLANHVMLDAFDHHVKRHLRVPAYVRYLDDLFLFGDQRGHLRAARDGAVAWLGEERGLVVKDPDTPLRPCAGRLDALGHIIRRRGVEALPRALRRVRARVRGLLAERGRRRLARSMASTAGVLLFGA
jgi:RNA-directed DNA polymerase